MQKRYVTEVIGKDYLEWTRGTTVFLAFPTGYGKTCFVVDTYLSHMQSSGKKVLILCNRKLLRFQYWFDLVQKFNLYSDLETAVQVATYQELYANYRRAGNLKEALSEYEAVVFDEAHYFVSDSDFNGGGTFLLFQALIEETICKTKIFISATPDLIEPIIREAIGNCVARLKYKGEIPDSYNWLSYYHLYENQDNDINYFDCWEIPDEPTLLQIMAKSDRKSIIFIDSKDKAEQWKRDLVRDHKVNERDIVLLNSENIDSNSDFVMRLSCAHLVDAKILITTCVLDNGVSIHDPDVGNLVILSENPISLKQMVGRIRTEHTSRINLYFLARSSKHYEKRMNHAKKEVEEIGLLKKAFDRSTPRPSKFIFSVWDEDNEALFYKKYVVVSNTRQEIYSNPEPNVKGYFGDIKVLLNDFAIIKLEQSYLHESLLYGLTLKSSTEAIRQQMEWLGLEANSLETISSEYMEDRKEQMITFLLSVRDYSSDKFQEMKRQLVKDFKALIGFDTRNGSISNKKLCQVCASHNLEVDISLDDERKSRYWIRRKESND